MYSPSSTYGNYNPLSYTMPTAPGAAGGHDGLPASSANGHGYYDPVRNRQSSPPAILPVPPHIEGSSPAGMPAVSDFSGNGQLGLPPQTPALTVQPTLPQPTPSAAPATIREDPAIVETRRKLARAVDALCNRYKLSAAHRTDLHQFAQLPVGVLERVDILHRCMQQALTYSQLEQFETTAFKFKELTTVLQDLETRLEETFRLTTEQLKNIRYVALSFVADPTRFQFLTLHEDIFNRCQTKAKAYNLSNILVNPHRRAITTSQMKRTASSVRNSMRGDVRDSVGLGDAKLEGALALVPFSNRVAAKYKPEGAPSDVALDTRSELTIKLAILRAFALANPELLAVEEDEDEAAAQQPQGQKRKKGGKGRVKKGKDFWSKVEQHLAELRKRFGTDDIKAVSWDGYVKKIIAADTAMFKSASNVSIMDLEEDEESVEGTHAADTVIPFAPAPGGVALDTPLSDFMQYALF